MVRGKLADNARRKLRSRYEAKAEEITPEMRERHAYFFSMIKPKRVAKRRPCLKCRRSFKAFQIGYDNNRICGECHAENKKIGALACY